MYPEVPTLPTGDAPTITMVNLYPHQYHRYKDSCYFMDYYGTIWLFRPTMDPDMPITITLVCKKPFSSL
jgi:hypothetical protein